MTTLGVGEMEFNWEHDRDHALLALVIKEGKSVVDEKGRDLGRIAVQKILYFLKVVGVPMGYRFEIYHYGPFCSQILRDTDMLEMDNIVVDHKQQMGSSYGPGENVDTLLENYSEELAEHSSTTKKLVNVLAPQTPNELERLATLDFIYRENKAKKSTGPCKEMVVDRFMEVKKNKFSRDEVEAIFDDMCNAGVFKL